ncbi:MAG TPA: caspase family protein [Thermoanaerobaculia bacterium]|nr:caspase family protein [Thermoanaerobaculia bacterium]
MPSARHAAIIGIDAYGNGIAALQSAVADARAVAAALEREHGYGRPDLLLDGEATGATILRLLEETLPAAVAPDGAAVLYYAGHGVALGDGSEGPEGFLLPQDARAGDESTWLPMERVRKALARLPCRHLLVVLDCCFAGSFRWASSRSFVPVGRPLYDSQYQRFLAGIAWQVLTSASHQERALDVAPGCRNTRGDGSVASHSPFAAALLRGLAGEADSTRGRHDSDGVISATELHQYIFEELVPRGGRAAQTPGIWPLKGENTGEFIFVAPGREVRTRPDPPLDDANNPWLGLQAYGRKDAALFFGRERVVAEILGRLLDPARSPLLAVVGASGTGKSSVVRAGVLARLEQPPEELAERIGAWTVARLPRLQGDPRPQLEEALRQLAAAPAGHRKLLFVDQFEELYTQCPDGAVREEFLRRLRELVSGEHPVHVVLTLRSDFEPRLAASVALGALLATGRYLVPAMTSEDYRDVVEEPAKAKALYFEPEALIGELVDEVMAMPGGLPLLSFALAEMYRQAQLRRRATGALDRALTRADDDAAGGVVGALHRRANELYEAADPARRETIRRAFLRLVSQEGGRLARRRVEQRELDAADPEEQARVRRVLDDYVAARLLVADESSVEPAHDTLVLAWEKLLDWLAAGGSQELLRQLWAAASAWEGARRERGQKRAAGLLWNQDPRLPLVQDRYLRQRPGELNRLEGEFAAASVARKRGRRKLVVGLTAAVILVLSAVAGVAEGYRRRAVDARDTALEEKLKAQDTARVAVAGQWVERDPTRAALVMLEVAKPDETAGAVYQMREILDRPLSEAILRGHEREVSSAAFSPDGTRIVTASKDGTARVWAADGSGEPVILRGHQGGVLSASFSPDGKRIVTASEDSTARVWSADGSGEPTVLDGLSAAFSPEGKRIVTGSYEGMVRIWAADGSGEPTVLDGLSAAFSPEGKRIVTSSYEGMVRIWAADGSGEPVILRELRNTASSVAFSPDGRLILATASDDTASVWPADGSSEPLVLRGHRNLVLNAAFSPDGKRIVTASYDGTARVWAADGSGEPVVLRGHAGPVLSAAFSPDGRRVVTTSADGTARLWAANGSGEPMVLRGHGGKVRSAAFSRGGTRIVTASDDGTARVWAAGGMGEPVILSPPQGQGSVSSAAFSPDGGRVVTSSHDEMARVWAADGSGEPVVLRGHESEVWSATFSPDGKHVLTNANDDTVRVWAADGTGEPVILRPQGTVSSAVFSPDGSRVVTTSWDGRAHVWAADGSGKPKILRGHEDFVSSPAFSPDGTRIVTASADHTARVWSAAGSGKPLILRGHEDQVVSAAFSPDGKRIVTASSDRTARVWMADGSGDPVVLRGHYRLVSSAVFSLDGKQVLTASDDSTARVWSADGSGEPVVLRGHQERVGSATFSPSGKYVLTVSDDGTARVWAADGIGESVVLRGHEGPVLSAAWSPDGTRIVTASEDGTARVWAAGERLLRALSRKATKACLEPEFRFGYLGETKDEAKAVYQRCRRCVGDWRSQFDNRAIRAAPEKAWAAWRQCMNP